MDYKFKASSLGVPQTNKKRVVIIGGGFAGVRLAKGLRGTNFQVVLLDRHNYHTFQPLLYQVATAGLEPDSIAGPLRKLLKDNPDFYFRLATVTHLHPSQKTIDTEIGPLEYDYLIIANGSRTNYFGQEDKFLYSFPLKQIPQALNLRSHLLQSFEKAVLSKDLNEQQSLMTFVIVGGGPTGVEVAGALGELRTHVLPKDYPELDLRKMKIFLIEGTGRLLNGMTDKSGEKALKYLEQKFGVEVLLNTLVVSFDGDKAVLGDGQVIPTQTLVWAAGVSGNIIPGLPQEAIERNRILVNEYNEVLGLQDIFALGDIACMKTEDHPNGLPMLAPVAIQHGDNLAKNLIAMSKSKALKPFKFKDKGSMATIGRNKAVVDLPGGMRFTGLFAWFTWMFVHLVYLIGFRSKIVVLSNWIWNYFTYDRGTRLIIRPFKGYQNEAKKE